MKQDFPIGILRTLQASVQSGLNATLTPDDCRDLLWLIWKYVYQKQTPYQKILNSFYGAFSGILEDMGERLRKELEDDEF